MVAIQSLTARLLVALVAPLIVSAVLIGIGDAWVTQRVVDYTSDRLLGGSVQAIAESVTFETDHVEVDLPPWAFGLLDSPQRDSVFYNVRQSGRVLTGYDDLPDFDARRSPPTASRCFERWSIRIAACARPPPRCACRARRSRS
jgi:two-component system sensor histidine kinase TctE